MELGPTAQQGLALLGATHSANLSDTLFTTLVSHAFQTLDTVNNGSPATSSPLSSLPFPASSGVSIPGASNFSAEAKLAYAGLCTLVSEVARHNAQQQEISSFLEESKWSESRISQFLTELDSHRAHLRSLLLSSLSNRRAILIDCSYRLDYYLHSDKSEIGSGISHPIYWISLTLREGETIKVVRFAANLQELQDWLAKIKDALKQVQSE